MLGINKKTVWQRWQISIPCTAARLLCHTCESVQLQLRSGCTPFWSHNSFLDMLHVHTVFLSDCMLSADQQVYALDDLIYLTVVQGSHSQHQRSSSPKASRERCQTHPGAGNCCPCTNTLGCSTCTLNFSETCSASCCGSCTINRA